MQEDRLRRSIAHALARTFRAQNRAFGRALKPFGISGEQAHVLALLFVEGPQTIGQLQRELSLSSATITGAIRRLEEAELVRREDHPGDRRTSRIAPAPWSDQKKRRLFGAILAQEDEALSALTRAERETLRELLERVRGTLERE
jgi:DNA-binding MarR family transcriptional regulator